MIDKVIAQRYQIVDLIGKGGMAFVYRAIDIRTGHSVAIKVLRSEFNQDEEFLSRFQREAEAASKVSHHNIVNLLDVGMDEGNRYLVMEYVQGKTLKAVIKEKGKLSPTTAVQIAIRILSALQHTHRNGIIHRDIKPQNILVQSEGHIKVADFGIARMANSSTLTKGDSVMGSVHYFSPEQAAGEEVVETGDIYSVGVVLYEMLTGQVPFEGDSPVAVAMQHIHNKPRPIQELAPEVPASIAKVVSIAMEKDPKYRYQNALDMAADLRRALESKDEDPKSSRREDSDRIPALSQTSGAQKKAKGDATGRLSGSRRHSKRAYAKDQVHSRIQRITRYTITGAASLLVLLGLVFGGVSIFNQILRNTTVPDGIGLTKEAATQRMEREGLKVSISEVHHDTAEANIVISQTPIYDTSATKGDTVALVVSLGPAQKQVPNFLGLLVGDISGDMDRLGFRSGITWEMSTEPMGTILAQDPVEGTMVEPKSTIQFTVSGGRVEMPNVIDIPLESATEILNEIRFSNWRLVGMPVTGDESIHPGFVISQTPDPGDAIAIRNSSGSIVLQVADERYRPYQKMVQHALEAYQEDVEIRITLRMAGGEEEVQYQAIHPAGTTKVLRVILYSDTPGDGEYSIYAGDITLREKQPIKLTETGE